MSNVNYISEVYLLSVPLESDYKHTLAFNNKDVQEEYFKTRIVRRFTDFSYVRKDNSLRIPSIDAMGLNSDYDSLINSGVNYVMFKNKKYNGKTFYSFIKELKYENDNLTIIDIETDVIQTWITDYTIKQSFVEREHVTDDSIGKHTLPENLEKGEYICNQHYLDGDLSDELSDLCYVLSSTLSTTEKSDNKYVASTGGRYNGIYSGTKYYAYGTPESINEVLDNYAGTGQVEAVNGLFMAPKILCNTSQTEAPGWHGAINQSNEPDKYEVEVTKNYNNIDSYVPINKKLLTYPFNYLMVSNNNGGNVIYRYEDFSNGDNATFEVQSVLCPGCSIRLVPTNYKGATYNDDEGINLGKYPSCNWATDMYTNWLTQNSKSISLSNAQNIANASIGAVGSLLSLDIGGAASNAINGYFGVAQNMAEVERQSMTPPQASGNLNCGDVITASGKNTFHFYKMSIKKEYAQIIDKFLSAYGYQVNDIKIPNSWHRPEYWFTKTTGINIDGKIPNNDMQIIKNCYNNGITFWVKPENIGNYNVTNKF